MNLPNFYQNSRHHAQQKKVSFIWSLHFQLLKLDQQNQSCPISTPRTWRIEKHIKNCHHIQWNSFKMFPCVRCYNNSVPSFCHIMKLYFVLSIHFSQKRISCLKNIKNHYKTNFPPLHTVTRLLLSEQHNWCRNLSVSSVCPVWSSTLPSRIYCQNVTTKCKTARGLNHKMGCITETTMTLNLLIKIILPFFPAENI